MPRGKTRAIYETDGGTFYVWHVDSDRFTQPEFNWLASGGGMNQVPRGAIPRHVTGISATSGRRGTAVVPNVVADIWTGAVNTFDIEADDQTTDTMTVTGRIGERPSMF